MVFCEFCFVASLVISMFGICGILLPFNLCVKTLSRDPKILSKDKKGEKIF